MILVAAAGGSPVVMLIGFMLGFGVPFALVAYRASRRSAAFEDQLPDLLMSIASTLKAGHSFKQGIQAAVDEGIEPAGKELKRALAETRLGRPLEESLGQMAERLGSQNFSFIVTAVNIQNQVGGSLAGLFDMVADTVRQRQQFARKIRSLTAMGRMSAYTLLGLPIFVAGALTLLNPAYMAPLYHTSTGQELIMVAVVMMLLGAAMLRKIISFRG
jgi:tight adherence protein B